MSARPVGSIWKTPPPDLGRLTTRALEAASDARVFFRADDIGVPSAGFARLLDLFRRHRTPLALAVVPSWVTPARWGIIRNLPGAKTDLWCWHQHGRRHVNHEPAGKKCEFGPSRSVADVERDLSAGRKRLETILGHAFFPAFTPPWNRVSAESLELLSRFGYHAISRGLPGRWDVPARLPDIPVHVDLHTRKEPFPGEAAEGMLRELAAALDTGFCGVMIHHQRMNEAAWGYLDLLLGACARAPGIRTASLPDLAKTWR